MDKIASQHSLQPFAVNSKAEWAENLDQMARQGYGNARFEVNSEEGLDLVEEFYAESSQLQDQKQVHDLAQVQDIQKGLQQSVRAVN